MKEGGDALNVSVVTVSKALRNHDAIGERRAQCCG
jgi:hypothetical protein